MDELIESYDPLESSEKIELELPKESMLWEYIRLSCTGGPKAKIIFIAVTSRVEGKKKSKGLPFGQGKSLFASILAAQIYQAFDSFHGLAPYKAVQENMGYTWEHHIEAIDEANNRRKLVYIMDDLQKIAGKSKSRDPYVQAWAEFWTTARPFCGVVIFTCPSIGELAKCFRELINFEIKIPQEGEYEVQFIKDYSDYYNPLKPKKSMKYKGEGFIPAAPQWFVNWYNVWRKESSYDSFVVNIKNRDVKQEKTVPIDEQYKRAKEAGLFSGSRDQFRELSRKKHPILEGESAAA